MGFKANVLRVMIASPSDVDLQRDEIENEIFKWNIRYSEDLKVVLLPTRWEKDSTPTYHGSNPQGVINEQVVSKSDILIGVFWTKLGTPTANHPSGTLEEIEDFISKGKEVMIYFINNDLPIDTDLQEFERLRSFKSEYTGRGIYFTYNKESISGHLYRKVVEYNSELKLKEDVQAIPSSDIINLEDLVISRTFTLKELLLLKFTIDTEVRSYGLRWMEDDTISLIKDWEGENNLSNELSSSYSAIINNLLDRNLLVVIEETSYGNPRLCSLPIEIFNQLRNMSDEAMVQFNESMENVRFPF
ncbi:hypothetical protein GLW04_00090 [Halobacillus litoralis]|uniref:DUF4062 domain-containing protein n=1 Tax=Halobacillus litoralis TaxID=45668 RepID=A0A845DNX7_9BACI|nr:hypothetical protein [Halobacillus litoralis]MYL18265.1 hypothetical protein [Halobacillus litoralis]MYL38744.1 hypothetical protein [Halobacillus litoralis]